MGQTSRREFLRMGASGAVGMAVLGQTGCAAVNRMLGRGAGKTRPNIVLIMADDLGYGDVGCYGATKVKTPNIDRLAREGTLFTDAHTPAAVCIPTRYGLLTGRYFWRVPGGWNRNDLLIEEDRTTVASVLKSAGYATGCVGKWHLGFGTGGRVDWNRELKPGPLEIGFDYYFGTPMSHNEAPHVCVENHYVVGLDESDPVSMTEPGDGAIWGVTKGGKTARFKEEELATRQTEKALTFIENNRDKPFFLYFPTNNIHDPLTPHPRFRGKSELGLYGDYIQELDWVVGEVLDALDRFGLADDTLVIFTSDNGAVYTPKVFAAGHKPNGELIGQKADAWEGGHRVPFLARWPNHVPSGKRSDELVCLTDILATTAALVGRDLKDDEGPDSCNILPALLNQPHDTPVRENLVMEGVLGVAIRENEWLLIPQHGSGGLTTAPYFPGWMDVGKLGFKNSDYTDQGKLKEDAPPGQLYDLAQDPGQSTNLYDNHPEIVERLTALLHRIERGAGLAQRFDGVVETIKGLVERTERTAGR